MCQQYLHVIQAFALMDRPTCNVCFEKYLQSSNSEVMCLSTHGLSGRPSLIMSKCSAHYSLIWFDLYFFSSTEKFFNFLFMTLLIHLFMTCLFLYKHYEGFCIFCSLSHTPKTAWNLLDKCIRREKSVVILNMGLRCQKQWPHPKDKKHEHLKMCRSSREHRDSTQGIGSLMRLLGFAFLGLLYCHF